MHFWMRLRGSRNAVLRNLAKYLAALKDVSRRVLNVNAYLRGECSLTPDTQRRACTPKKDHNGEIEN